MLTAKQDAYRKKLIKLAHTLKNSHDYFSEEDNRRDWLLTKFGCRSFTECSIDELEEFLDEVKGTKNSNSITKKQIYAINSMWSQYSKSKDKKSLLKFVGKTAGITVIDVRYLTRKQAVKVLTGMYRMFELER